MAKLSTPEALKLLWRGTHNCITKRPLVVSFEVTLSCNCNCRHCDLGGMIKNEKLLQPDDFARLTRLYNSPVVQLSGGEPLLRQDIVAVVKAIKQSPGVPYLILVTNGALLNEDIYRQLHEAGVNQLSVSLDFPDERHDDFRRHRGLYQHLDETIPRLAKLGYRDIILNSAITRANLKELLPLAQQAREWNVFISYSAYTPLRTNNDAYSISGREDLELLRRTIYRLIELKEQGACITNSRTVLLDTLKFFEQGYMPGCKAGERFFVIMPDGSLVPCSLHRSKYSSQKEMLKEFSRNNQCGACYVSIRSYIDQPLWRMFGDAFVYGKQLFAP